MLVDVARQTQQFVYDTETGRTRREAMLLARMNFPLGLVGVAGSQQQG